MLVVLLEKVDKTSKKKTPFHFETEFFSIR